MRICIKADEHRRIAVIDYLKGFSIFTIMLMHLLKYTRSMPSQIVTMSGIGGTGVHVFFLCSGLGLYMSFLRHRLRFTEFLAKRMVKIYVPYIIVVAVSFLLPWTYSGEDRVAALLSHVFLFKMFVPQYVESFGTQFWFMSTIFQLYLLFIPMCWLKDKLRSRSFFVLFMGVSVIWWILCYVTGWGQSRIWGSFCLQYIWEFALGMVLAEKLNGGKKYEPDIRLLLVLAVAGIGVQAGTALLSPTLNVFNDIPALIGYASLALLVYPIPLVRKLFTKLSAFSYECYLVHVLVFSTAFHLLAPRGLAMQFFVGVLAVAAAIAVGYGVYMLQQMIPGKQKKAG